MEGFTLNLDSLVAAVPVIGVLIWIILDYRQRVNSLKTSLDELRDKYESALRGMNAELADRKSERQEWQKLMETQRIPEDLRRKASRITSEHRTLRDAYYDDNGLNTPE